ncbi:hypothetical protein EWB00_003006, partial [Schistosoma japonicum]
KKRCARHCPLFVYSQLITANNLTPQQDSHHIYMGTKVVQEIKPYFLSTNQLRQSTYTHNISLSSLNTEKACARHCLIILSTTLHRQSTNTDNISSLALYVKEGCTRHCPLVFHAHLITDNQLTPTTYRHHLYM